MTEDSAVIRVLLADDQSLIRSGIRALLDAEDDIEVVAEASDGQQAVALASEHRPDIALVDIQMPVLDGIEATRKIVADERLASVRVLILTNFGLDEYIFRALRAGASGFLLKDTQPAELLRALRVVMSGDSLLSPAVTSRLISEFVARPPDAVAAAGMERLTNREREVVGLVAHGLSNDEIADVMVLSPATAKTHVSRAMVKLGARDRAQLVVFAYQSGLVSPRSPAPRRLLDALNRKNRVILNGPVVPRQLERESPVHGTQPLPGPVAGARDRRRGLRSGRHLSSGARRATYARRSPAGLFSPCRRSLAGRRRTSVKTLSKFPARLLAAATIPAGALAVTVAFALPASAGTGAPALAVHQIAFGAKLHHAYQRDGKGAQTGESLTSPDDITRVGHDLFVTFQNGIGPQGQASPDGNLDSTIVEFTMTGGEVRQWDVRGHCDGLTADPLTGKVIATVNEDANSSLFTIDPRSGTVTHYAYNEPLPHKGGTDAIEIYHGQILISASAPGTTGKAAPQPSYPAVYVVTLNPWTRVATVDPLYYDEASATAVNGPHAGKTVRLGLTDPDSNEDVPPWWPAEAGDFLLDSQGDEELIFDHVTRGWQQSLSVLKLTASVDDTAFAVDRSGVLYATDPGHDTVDAVAGTFTPGTTFDAVTPCDENGAPATCPAPGYPANYLATLNMTTGALTPVPLSGPSLEPQGMLFVP